MFPLLSPHFSHCDCTISYVRQSRQKAETTPSHPTGMPLTSCTPARHHRRECRPQQGKKPVPPTGFPRSLVESTCNAGDLGPIPGLGRFPGEGNGNPPQYSCLENPMDRGAWRPAVHGVPRGGHSIGDAAAASCGVPAAPSAGRAEHCGCWPGTVLGPREERGLRGSLNWNT